MSTILVLEAYRQTLAVARSLGRRGHRVLLGHSNEPGGQSSACQASRFVHESIELPSPLSSRAYGEAVLSLLRNRSDIGAVFPVGEEGLRAVLEVEDEVRALKPLVAPSREAALNCLDKDKAAALAAQAGIPVPSSRRASSLTTLDEAVRSLGYPSVVKPIDSITRVAGRKALILASDADFAEWLPTWPAGTRELLVQKKASGFRHNCMFQALEGKVIAYFESRVLRTDTHDGTGYGVESISVQPDPRRRAWVEALARKLAYTGPGCAQFMVDGQDSIFLELNPRLDASCALAIHCGVDLPSYALATALGETVTSPAYPSGQRLYWFFGDLYGVAHAVHARLVGVGGALTWLSRMATAALVPAARMTWSFSDPLPSLVIAAQFVAIFFKILAKVKAL